MWRSIGQLGTLSWITFLESLRNRAFLALVLTALGFLAFSLVLSGLSLRDQSLRVVTDFGVFSLGLLGMVIAVVLGVILVHKEVQRKTIYTVLSKPVPRSLFVVGKYLGLCAMLVVTLAVLMGAWFMVLGFRGGSPSIEHVLATVLVAAEVVLITAVAVFFSTFATPVMSGVFTGGFFLIGRNVPAIEHLLGRKKGVFAEVPVMKSAGEGLARAMPDLTVFQASDYLLHGIPIQGSYVVSAWAYSASYVALFLVLGILAFQRRDFI